nr:MAG TPA: hypothetical protein [Caudoviricetes sp.]
MIQMEFLIVYLDYYIVLLTELLSIRFHEV